VRIDYQFRNVDEGERRFREHTEPRLESLLEQFSRIQSIRVTVAAQRNWRTVDITVDVAGALLRAEEETDDALAAFDKAHSRIERQLRRFRDRTRDFSHESLRTLAAEEGGDWFAEEEPDEAREAEAAAEGLRIVRTKSHSLKPMTPEEAALQMELLNHDFFVFVDGDTERVGVVYRRRAGGYGLIEPEVGD
jgi:putative sigma-54 modulation protein